MDFEKGVGYTREQIAAVVGIGSDEAPHAVLLKLGKVEAVVVAANGRHPSGKKYQNTLTASTFVMHGEKDQRGVILEQATKPIRLFYANASDGRHRYEGKIRWVKTADYAGGDPFREFARVADE